MNLNASDKIGRFYSLQECILTVLGIFLSLQVFAGSLDSARSQYTSDLTATARASNAQNQLLQKQYEAGLADHLSRGTPIPNQIIDQMRSNDRDYQKSRTQTDNTFTSKQAAAKGELKQEIAGRLLGKPLPKRKNTRMTAEELKEDKKSKALMKKMAKNLPKGKAKVLKNALNAGIRLRIVDKKGDFKESSDDKDKDRKPAANGGRTGYIAPTGPAREAVTVDGSNIPKEVEFSGPKAVNPPAGPAPVQKQ